LFMLKHDSPLCGASCGSVNVSSNNSLKFKNNKKKHLQIKLPDLFLLKHLLFECKKKIPLNQNQLQWLTLSDPQLAPPSGESCFSMNNYMFV
jgi:hypothetical protein